jgi:DNA polymerase-3 subunit epsilon
VVIATVNSEGHLRHGRLIAVGAVAVHRGCIDLGDGFERVLRQQRAAIDSNTATHGVDGEQQLAGAEPKEALLDFLEYVGKSPLVAFRAEEHLAMVARGIRTILGYPLEHPWVDLAVLLEELFPDANGSACERWLARFGLDFDAGRSAVGEALAAAQLLQVGLAAAERAGRTTAARIIAMQKARSTYGRYR